MSTTIKSLVVGYKASCVYVSVSSSESQTLKWQKAFTTSTAVSKIQQAQTQPRFNKEASYITSITILFFFKNFFVGLRSILWGHWLPLFWTSCDPPHGFQNQDGSLTCTLTCLHTVKLRAMAGATPAFSTNRCVR